MTGVEKITDQAFKNNQLTDCFEPMKNNPTKKV